MVVTSGWFGGIAGACNMAVVADCTSSSGVAGGITEAQLKDQFSRLYGSASQSLGPECVSSPLLRFFASSLPVNVSPSSRFLCNSFTWDNSFSLVLRNTSATITYTIENALCSEAGTKSGTFEWPHSHAAPPQKPVCR